MGSRGSHYSLSTTPYSLKLHDSTRRALSLLTFFLLGPILTIGILFGIGLRHLPSNARQFERLLSSRTGLDWSVETIDYRRPDLVRLKNTAISHFQVSKPLFHASEIDLSFVPCLNRDEFFPGIEIPEPTEAPPWGILGFSNRIPAIRSKPEGFWRILIPRAVVQLEDIAPENVTELIEEGFFKILARFSTLSDEPVQIVLDEIVVRGPHGAPDSKTATDRLRFVVGNFYRTSDKVRSDWTFQIPTVSETETQHFSVAAYRGSGGFEIALKTGEYPIPCNFAALFSSTFRPFSGGRFSGEISGEFRKGGLDSWTIRMRNAFFRNLDVASFTAEYTPFEVTGTVHGLEIKQAEFGRNMFAAEGWLYVVNGSIEQTLFNRLVDRFSLTVDPASILEAPFGSIPFDHSVVFFRLMQDGAAFWTEQGDNLFMSRSGDGVRSQPMTVFFPASNNRQPISYHAIMSALAPDTAPIVPLTPGSQKIISILPADSFSRPIRLPDGRPNPSAPPEMQAVRPIAPQPAPANVQPRTADPWSVPLSLPISPPRSEPPTPPPTFDAAVPQPAEAGIPFSLSIQ